jgi:glycosyltransferase involved in cell wall biosynthesis
MPTYNQSSYIRRAIISLFDQTYSHWELIIINDGCTDCTEEFIEEFLTYPKITYIKNIENQGLGYAINQGLNAAKYAYIAYLPSDDYYYENHLKIISEEFERSADIVLTYTIINSDIKDSLIDYEKRYFHGLPDKQSLQLVQTAHKKTSDRWVVRSEWVSADLFDLFWQKLTDKGLFTAIKENTVYWTNHPNQHYKLVSEDFNGGLNIYRSYYKVKKPIKIKVSKYKFINEEELYKDYRAIKVSHPEEKPLKILIVGELAYNPERICAFEEYGHTMYGLWISKPTYSFSTVGHLPFGNVIDISYENWEQKVREIHPDIIYATLNYGVIPLAHEVLQRKLNIPFIWHFKESPFFCQQSGTWDKLIDLYCNADGKIYLNPELQTWYEQFFPSGRLSFIMDGDLPKKDFFTDNFSPLLSEEDGEIHTVVPGRMIGILMPELIQLAKNGIHIHSYNENYHKRSEQYNRMALKTAPDHFHLHPHCPIDKWAEEFSKYNAGWLHCFNSTNKGHIRNAGWDDLNMPARMNTLAVAGLPIIQKRNSGHIVAMRSYIENKGMGIFFDTFEELATQLRNKELMASIRRQVIKQRFAFSFDYYVPELIEFFRKVIQQKK